MSNITIKRLLEFEYISNDEYALLFCNKENWNSQGESYNKERHFWELFSKIKDILGKKKNIKSLKLIHQESQFDFSYIRFPDMKSSPIYEEYLTIDTTKYGYIYKKPTSFSHCIFYGNANFKNVTFEDEVKFEDCIFHQDADFSEILFEGDTFFTNSTFKKNITFENSFCKEDTFDFTNIKLGNLKLDKSLLVNASYLYLIDEETNGQTTLKNFETRETTRIIKSRFEEQKNLKDAYYYFTLEQNLYISELKIMNLSLYKKFITLIPLYMDKYISNFGTDWIRVFIWIILFSLIVFLVHYGNSINCIKESFSLNKMVELINPLTIFKKNDIYQDNQGIGMLVRIISIYFIWQFTKSFRVTTKNS